MIDGAHLGRTASSAKRKWLVVAAAVAVLIVAALVVHFALRQPLSKSEQALNAWVQRYEVKDTITSDRDFSSMTSAFHLLGAVGTSDNAKIDAYANAAGQGFDDFTGFLRQPRAPSSPLSNDWRRATTAGRQYFADALALPTTTLAGSSITTHQELSNINALWARYDLLSRRVNSDLTSLGFQLRSSTN